MKLASRVVANLIANGGVAQISPPPTVPSPGGVSDPPAGGPLVRFLMNVLLHPQEFWNRARQALVDALTTFLPVAMTVVGIVVLAIIAFRLYVLLREIRLGRRGRRIRILVPPSIPTDGGAALWAALHAHIKPAWKRLISGQPYFAWEVSVDVDHVELSSCHQRACPQGSSIRAFEGFERGLQPTASAFNRSKRLLLLSHRRCASPGMGESHVVRGARMQADVAQPHPSGRVRGDQVGTEVGVLLVGARWGHGDPSETR